MGVLGRKAPQQLAGKITGIYIYLLGNSVWPLTAQNGPKRPVLGPFWGIAAACGREKIYYFFSIAEPLNFFCAASHRQTTNAYLRKFEGQHFRPPTQEIPQNQNA